MTDDPTLIARVARDLSAPVPTDPRAKQAVLRAVASRRLEHGPLARAWEWLVEPRFLSVSPVAAVVVLALVAAAAVASLWGGPKALPPTRQLPVQFVLIESDARSVALVGDFNNWDPRATALAQTGEDGVWSVVVPLPPGRHRYAFVVNGGRWVPDARAPRTLEDDFGLPNSVIYVGG
jgi:hypothetical protein